MFSNNIFLDFFSIFFLEICVKSYKECLKFETQKLAVVGQKKKFKFKSSNPERSSDEPFISNLMNSQGRYTRSFSSMPELDCEKNHQMENQPVEVSPGQKKKKKN